MQAITVNEPLASLVVAGYKHVLTMGWGAPRQLTGKRIAIHAAKRPPDRKGLNLLEGMEPLPAGYQLTMMGWIVCNPSTAPLGKVMATATLAAVGQVDFYGETEDRNKRMVHCTGYPEDRWAVVDKFGDFSMGRWIWFLEDVEKVTPPVPAQGYQGFWTWDGRQ